MFRYNPVSLYSNRESHVLKLYRHVNRFLIFYPDTLALAQFRWSACLLSGKVEKLAVPNPKFQCWSECHQSRKYLDFSSPWIQTLGQLWKARRTCICSSRLCLNDPTTNLCQPGVHVEDAAYLISRHMLRSLIMVSLKDSQACYDV